jgi:hypothetical protein
MTILIIIIALLLLSRSGGGLGGIVPNTNPAIYQGYPSYQAWANAQIGIPGQAYYGPGGASQTLAAAYYNTLTGAQPIAQGTAPINTAQNTTFQLAPNPVLVSGFQPAPPVACPAWGCGPVATNPIASHPLMVAGILRGVSVT